MEQQVDPGRPALLQNGRVVQEEDIGRIGGEDEDDRACGNLQEIDPGIRQFEPRQTDGKHVVDPDAHPGEDRKAHREERENGPEHAEEHGDEVCPEEVAVERHPHVHRNKVFVEAPVSYGVALHPPADKAAEVRAGGQHHRTSPPRSSREAITRSRSTAKIWMIRATAP